jgi:hypothetical protein
VPVCLYGLPYALYSGEEVMAAAGRLWGVACEVALLAGTPVPALAVGWRYWSRAAAACSEPRPRPCAQTHAPRCAWLNHSDRPQRFIRLVERYPNVRLWFSGHFHLAQNYPDRRGSRP